MRKLLTALLALACLPQFVSAQNEKVIATNPQVITGQLVRTTAPLTAFQRPAGWIDVPVRDENGRIWPAGKKPLPFEPVTYPEQQQVFDPVIQKKYSFPTLEEGNTAARSIGVNFNGMGYTFVNPPDPTICAGPNHVIQMINGGSGAYFKVFNKAGGQVVAQTYLDQITGFGGLGDPIAEYDHLANRFVLLEFVNSGETGGQEGLVIAVSQTPDPAGSWNVYFFPYGTTFPDYPKLSIWTDAYYCTTNDFTFTYVGSSAWAFDRAAMIAGNATAAAQRISVGSASKHFSMCPVLLQGNTTPPAGTGGLIAYMQDNAWTASTTDVDSVGLFEFDVNFAVPASSTFTHRASLAAGAFKSDICTATRGRCISQPGSTIALEALQQKIMNQPVYRNFGGYEGIVLTHLLDKGSNISAVRWYELTKAGSNWGINQQATYSPDNTHRFMPSICYDAAGNIGLVYNVSSGATSVFPGVRYTGRKQCDPLNSMTYSEDVIIAGTAANGSNRYGDYNHLVADPDGVTFWMTAEWNSSSQWSTRVASFTLDNCTPVCQSPSGLNASAITTNSATVGWTAVASAVSYDVDYKQASSSLWINAATATTSTSVNLGGLNASTLYDYRVRTNCASGSSAYSSAQFTTAAVPPPCGTPTGLNASAITPNTATVGWTAVPNAISYDVDYKEASSGTWINAATATTNTSVNLSGLNPSTVHDWRVRATCPAGTGNYAQSQFTTAIACGTPAGLNTSAITTNSATVSWTAVPNATSYDVDYKLSSVSTWTNAATGTASTSVNLTGLAASSLYDWRVRATCPAGTGAYAQSSFTTASPPVTCPGPYDVSTNGTTGGAATIPLNTNVLGNINPRGDIDNYRFVITTGGTISLTLGTLPANYQLSLLNSGGGTLATSQNNGTAGEAINNVNVAAGTYYARVFPKANASSSSCYTLRVITGTATPPETDNRMERKEKINVFPNPATHSVQVSISGFKGSYHASLYDVTGRLVMQRNIYNANTELNIERLAPGTYTMKIRNADGDVSNVKVIKY